jgi:hypothetical protein
LNTNTPVKFVNPGQVERSQILELITDGSMPPGGVGRPSPAEIDILRQWIKADAPSYPRAFDEAGTLEEIARDAAALKPAEASHIRYLSLAHLIGEDGNPSALNQAEFKLRKALLAASDVRNFIPEPVDDSATLFRLDLRPARWSDPELFTEQIEGTNRGKAAWTIFDLLLLEYPYAVTLPPEHKVSRLFLKDAQQMTPVPYLRGDWLAEVLRPGGSLSEELKSLTDLAKAIQANPDARPVGPDLRRFEQNEPLTIPLPKDGSKPIVPLNGLSFGHLYPERRPFDLTVEIVDTMEDTPEVLKHVKVGQPFRLRVKASKDVKIQLVELVNDADGPIRVLPLADGSDVDANTPRLVMPRAAAGGKGFVFATIPAGVENHAEHFLLYATLRELPLPQVVRSIHGSNNIWRFRHRTVDDPASTIRILVTIPVVSDKKK